MYTYFYTVVEWHKPLGKPRWFPYLSFRRSVRKGIWTFQFTWWKLDIFICNDDND